MSEDLKSRLAAARKAKEDKEAARAAAAEARELEELELEAKLEGELGGSRGSAFEIVRTLDGLVAVKLGPAILHTKFQAAASNDKVGLNERTLHDYVFPNVAHPSQDAYLAMVAKRPGTAVRCADALATLYGAKASNDDAKY